MDNKTNIVTDHHSTYLTELVIDKLNKQELEIIRLRELVSSLVPSEEPERFYTVEETTEILKMSRKSLYLARIKGDIHYRKYNDSVWFSKSDIEEFQLKIKK